MVETFQPNPDVQMPPVALDETAIQQAAQNVVLGAEAYLAEQPTTPAVEAAPEAAAPQVEFNMDMLKLFMLVKDEHAREVLAGAMALDVVGQQYGIKEFTFDNAVQNVNNRHAAIEADAARQRAEDEADDDDKKDQRKYGLAA